MIKLVVIDIMHALAVSQVSITVSQPIFFLEFEEYTFVMNSN